MCQSSLRLSLAVYENVGGEGEKRYMMSEVVKNKDRLGGVVKTCESDGCSLAGLLTLWEYCV